MANELRTYVYVLRTGAAVEVLECQYEQALAALGPADLKVTMHRAADDRWVVRAEHLPSGVSAESDPSGSALRARMQAIERLRLLLPEEDGHDQD